MIVIEILLGILAGLLLLTTLLLDAQTTKYEMNGEKWHQIQVRSYYAVIGCILALGFLGLLLK